MSNSYYGVAVGRVPGIYTNWSSTQAQTDGYPSECKQGFQTLDECVNFMVGIAEHSESNIKVFGPRGGQYTLQEWKKKTHKDMDNTTVMTADTSTLVKQVRVDAQPTQPVMDIAMCLVSCLHGHNDKQDKDMIRCCVCAHWYHLECVKLPASEASGVWPCMECRQMPTTLKTLVDSVQNLTSVITHTMQKLQKNEEDRKQERDELLKDNATLRDTIATLNAKITQSSWSSFRSADKACTSNPSTPRVLLGSSIIRTIDEQKLDRTKVVCKPGAKIDDIKRELNNLPSGYDEVTLVVGGNDCDSKHPRSADDIVKSYGSLIDSAKTKAKKVFISGLCPRLTSDATQEKIEAVNAGLTAACADNNVTFIDTNPMFRLQDGSINDGYLLPDGVHLTRAATNKIAKCLDLKIKNVAEGVCRDTSRAAPEPQTTRQADNHHDTSDWTNVRHRSKRRHDNQRSTDTRSTNARCYFCGESGHLHDICKHGKAITCYECGRTGHKSKLCTYSNRY